MIGKNLFVILIFRFQLVCFGDQNVIGITNFGTIDLRSHSVKEGYDSV